MLSPIIVKFLTFVSALVGSLIPAANAQSFRTFPPLVNLAVNQAVSTTPAQSTCGAQTMGAYCVSSVSPSSAACSNLLMCAEDCPSRTALPGLVSLLAAGGYGTCISTDGVNVHPGSAFGSYSSVFFGPGPACYLSPTTVPTLGSNGSFTISFWVWPNSNTTG